MNKYEAVIILNPNLSSKADSFLKEFETLLSSNSFKIIKTEDVGRRQLAYSINNHNKGHYLLFNLEGDPSKLIEIENKIKYNESIIRHLFINVKSHNGEDSQLLVESKTKKKDSEVEDISSKVEAKETIETEKKDNKEEDADKMEDKTKTENDSVEVKDE
ncbi:MAG: 30S ribosomal protein S6 [Gammaproteobacteria bacterium]|nr:30S ribosomal protein S6 [Gammaproteobacteria bacterium]|tara:strand:+ start:1368 stop:1847 length:480 start_codon:yes stop_codon:yes gene_type:complete